MYMYRYSIYCSIVFIAAAAAVPIFNCLMVAITLSYIIYVNITKYLYCLLFHIQVNCVDGILINSFFL